MGIRIVTGFVFAGTAGRTTTCLPGTETGCTGGGVGFGAGGVGFGASGFTAGGDRAATNGGGSSGFINMLMISGVQTTSLLSVLIFFGAGGVLAACCTGRMGRGRIRLFSGILAAPGAIASLASGGRLTPFLADIGVLPFLFRPLLLQHVVLSCFIRLLMVCTERFLSFISLKEYAKKIDIFDYFCCVKLFRRNINEL